MAAKRTLDPLEVLRKTSRGAYNAKDMAPIADACAHRNTIRVHATLDPRVAEALTDYDRATRQRMDDGLVFEAEVGDQLVADWEASGGVVVHHGGRTVRTIRNHITRQLATGARVLFVNDEDHDIVDLADGGRLSQSATIAAMRAGVHAVWGAVLPYSEMWSGKPDMLALHDPDNAASGYVGIDVKHHKTLKGKTKPKLRPVASLTSPHPTTATPTPREGSPQVKDAMQLGHYYRRLVELDLAGPPVGGVIGKGLDGTLTDLVFIPLDRATFTAEVDGRRSRRSANELADTSYRDYVRLVRHETRRFAQPSRTAPLTRPTYRTDCTGCPMYANICKPQMRDSGEATATMAGLTPNRAYPHEANGRYTTADIAALDRPTALAVGFGMDVPSMIDAAQALDPDLPADTLYGRYGAAKRAALADAGIRTVGDIAQMCPDTAAYAGLPHTSGLADQIDRARAVRACGGEGRVFRARDVDVLDLGAGHVLGVDGRPSTPARADVEVHIDMENDLDDLFWVGLMVRHVRVDGGESTTRDRYIPISAFDFPEETDADRRSALVMAETWKKLRNLQRRHRGKTLRVYYYTAAEKRVFSHHATVGQRFDDIATPSPEDIDAAFDSPVWVDLAPLVQKQLIWPTPNHTLKTLAKYTRFSWRDEDPSGENCVLWYREAQAALAAGDLETAEQLIDRMSAYNEDDCAATARLVQWLWDLTVRTPHKLESIASLDDSPVFQIAI